LKISKTAIDRLKHDGRKGHHVLWDSEIPGFGVRVFPTGAKTFVYRFRVGGRRGYRTIGKYGPLTLTEAREMARLLYVGLQQGSDPSRSREKELTVAELGERYMRIHARPKKKSAEKDQALLTHHLVPALGTKPARSVTRGDVARLHDKISQKHPVAANRVLSLVSKMWAFADQRELVPAGHPNPGRGIERNKETKRERYVTAEEMPALADAIRAEPNPIIRGMFWLYILTGLRKSELLYAKWEDLTTLDTPRGNVRLLRIEDTKSGKPHTLPLPAVAAELLDRIPRRAGGGLIFAGPNGKPMSADSAWKRIRKKAGIEDVRVHDLRHTTISLMVQNGVPLAIAGEVANHSAPSVTAGYAHHAMDPVRDALETVGGLLEGHVLGPR